MKINQVKTVLDVGCGSGAHLKDLAEQGFDVVGIDSSKIAIQLARKTFKQNHLAGKFLIGDVSKPFPFTNNYFDAVICLRTLNHGNYKTIRGTAREIERVLKDNGIVYISVQKVLGFRGKRGLQILNNLKVNFIEKRTYLKLQGEEKGIPHFLMSRQSLISFFDKLRITRFWISYGKETWEKYYQMLGVKK